MITSTSILYKSGVISDNHNPGKSDCTKIYKQKYRN